MPATPAVRSRLDDAFALGPTAHAHVEEAAKGQPQQSGKHRRKDTYHARDSSIRAQDGCAAAIALGFGPRTAGLTVGILLNLRRGELFCSFEGIIGLHEKVGCDACALPISFCDGID